MFEVHFLCFALLWVLETSPAPNASVSNGNRAGLSICLQLREFLDGPSHPHALPPAHRGSRLTSHWGPIWLLVWVRALCSEALQAVLAEGRLCQVGVKQQLGTQSTCPAAGGSRPPPVPLGNHLPNNSSPGSLGKGERTQDNCHRSCARERATQT